MRFFFLFFLSFLSFISIAQQWYLSPVYHQRNVYSVYPHSRTNIIAGGGNEQNDSLQDIFKSYSGGMTWDFANNGGGGYIRSIDFTDSINGIAIGYAGKILKSGDGGGSYSRIYPPGAMTQRNFTTVLYNSPQTVFGFGGRNYPNDTIQTIIKSTDGGSTWNAIRDQAGRWLKGAFFINANNGFAVGGSGTIIKTTDGGSNWTDVTSPIHTRDFNAVHFSSPSTGYIVGGNFVMFDTLASMRTILKTTDGGANWNVVMDEPGGWLTAIDFVDVNTGYITGDAAQLYKTTNGGTNWIRQTVQGTQWYSNLTSVKFLNQDFGVVGGMYGEVYLYSTEPLPEVVTAPATVTQVNDTSANVILRANINTHGNPVTYNFIYSTTPDFSSDVNFAFSPIWPTTFNSSVLQNTESVVNNLLPNTTYYYYATATSVNGVVNGDVQSFVTYIPFQQLQTNYPQTNLVYTVFSGTVGSPSETLSAYFEYGTTTQFGSEVQANPFLLSDTLNYSVYDTIFSLQANTLYYYRLKVVSQNSTYYANTVAFFTGNLYANFEATEATQVTETTATLNAEIDNFSLPVSDITFLYGTDPFQFTNWINSTPAIISDTLQHSLSVDVSSLTPHTFYYYKVTGETQLGQQSTNTSSFYTGDYSLDFQALPATTVGETFATLNGFIDGFVSAQLPAEITFEYGPTTSFGQTIQSTPFIINDTLSHDLTAFVTNLPSGSTHYFRIKAETQAGFVYSNLQSFNTALTGNYFSTLPATDVTVNSAKLNGKITNINFPVVLSFEYGLTNDFGTTVTATPELVDDTLYHQLSAAITGLIPDTFYYFRIKAGFGSEFFYTEARKLYTGEPEIPNWNFENWNIDTLLLPEQWNIANDENFERVAGYSGSYALKISQVNFAILGFPGDGEGNNDGPNFFGGCPFSSRPDSVGFYLNYNINPLDSAVFISHLYSGDSIISTGFRFISGNSGGNFQHFAFPIEYNSTLTPDSIVLGFASFNPFSSVVNDPTNNFMIIDDIRFTPSATHNCNIDFEDWFEFVFDNPQDWYYFKTLAIDPDNIEESRMVKKVQGINADEYAVQIQNVNISGYIFNASFATIKGKDFFGPTTSGTPVNRRYSRLNGYYKYSCSEPDTVVIALAMFKNGINVGYGRAETSGDLDDFQFLDIPISYFDEVTIPDSVVIDFNTNNRGSATGHATITIDRLSFDGIWGEVVTDTTGVENRLAPDDVKIYPNPAKNTFVAELSDSNFKVGVASVMDINGRVINQVIFSAGQSRISFDVSGFDAGIYFVKIATDDKVFSKKIVVVK